MVRKTRDTIDKLCGAQFPPEGVLALLKDINEMMREKLEECQGPQC